MQSRQKGARTGREQLDTAGGRAIRCRLLPAVGAGEVGIAGVRPPAKGGVRPQCEPARDEYLLPIRGKEKSATSAYEGEAFVTLTRNSGVFRGGSAVGKREFVGDRDSVPASNPVVGYVRFASGDKQILLGLLDRHPVVLPGGTGELCELPEG
jgi:hypothetical protein